MLAHSHSTGGVEADKINPAISGEWLKFRLADASNSWGSWGYATNQLKKNAWNRYTISWDKTNAKARECLNGEIKEYTDVPYFPSVVPSYFYIGRWGSGKEAGHYANMPLRNVSIYNKYLSNDQIRKLHGSFFEINKYGNVKTIISEKPSMPSDVYYFPLGANAKDDRLMVSAVTSERVVYEDGGAWVGEAARNLIPNSTRAYIKQEPVEDTSLRFKGESSLKVEVTGKTEKTWSGPIWYSIPFGAGKTYTFSIYAMTDDLNTLDDYICIGAETYDSNNVRTNKDFNTYMTISNKWIRYSLNFTVPSNAARFNVFAYVVKNGRVWFACPQVEEKPFISPYTPSFRDFSKLHFNLNSSIGLDWSGDWSIAYFKKPIGYNSISGQYYSIESLGANNNSVGGGYTWWGKDSSGNIISRATPWAFDSNNYYNKWHLITLVKSGTTLTIKEWLPGGPYVRSETVNTTATNYYVNQYGYDLMLGGWDSNAACNAYYRDLIVAKRALTDTEIKNICDKFMSAKPHKLQIQGGLSEGAIL